MRFLINEELRQVGGGEGSETSWPWESDDGSSSKKKNNNGYGNGAESGPPPGNSGAHNPGLLTWNSGPRGPR